jgi:chromate transporter
MEPTIVPVEKPSFKEAFWFWLKLGFISFGGPAGQIAIMHSFLVEQKKWISDSRFLHALNYCMLLPGPEAQQLATYIGWLLHGVRGGLIAGIFFVLPSVAILLLLSVVYVSYGTIPWVYALFYGLKPAVVAIVLLALIKIGKKSLLGPLHYAVAALSFAGIFLLNIPFPYLIIGTILLALLINRFAPGWLGPIRQEQRAAADESGYYLNRHSVLSGTGFRAGRLIRQVGVFALLWITLRPTLRSGSGFRCFLRRRPLLPLGEPTPYCPTWRR